MRMRIAHQRMIKKMMNNMDTELLKKQIEALNPNYRTLLASNFMSELAQTFGAVHDFSREDLLLFEVELLYFALFFYSEEDFKEVLQTDFGFTYKDADILTTAILQVFPAQYDQLHEAVIDFLRTDEEVTDETNGPAAVETNYQDLQSEIEETQANFNSIQPMRTMAHDMETIKQTDVPNYTGASQEELLRKKPEDLDAAEPTEQNRWGAA